MLERLDYSSDSQRESEIVNPEWLDDLGESDDENAGATDAGGLNALLGLDADERAPGQDDVAASLEGLLDDNPIEAMFSELAIGETVAAVSPAQPEADETEALLSAMEDKGFIAASAPTRAADELPLGEAAAEAPEFTAQSQDNQADEATDAELDGDLADLLERLDSSEEGSDWDGRYPGWQPGAGCRR